MKPRISILLTITLWGVFIITSINAMGQAQLPAVYPASVKVSYVRTWDAVRPETNYNNFTAGSSLLQSRVATQYVDGLGRPVETVVKQGSLITGSTATDLVNAVVFDGYGREIYKYLPFAANSAGGNTSISDGLFKINPFQQDSAFNKGIYPDESWYYAQTNFEPSPLNRALESFAPGNNWVGTSGQGSESNRRSTKIKYWINAASDSVRVWKVTDVAGGFGTYTTNSMYLPGSLYKNVSVDEVNNLVIEFKDKEGKVILKKVQLTASSDTGTGKGYSGWLNTYYIYDNFNNLRCVIQPRGVEVLAGVANWNLSYSNNVLLNEQCFRYEYDKRQRMILKKIPGAGPVWMVYDAMDRLVLSQDSLLRAAHQWLCTQYDMLSRPMASGLLTDNSNYNNPAYHSSRADTSYAYPATGSYTIDTLTKTFYDDYSWRASQGNPLSGSRITSYDSYLQTPSNTNWPYPQDATVATNQVRGLVTGTKTRVLGGPATYIYSVSLYDEKVRVVQTQSQNITAGTDVITTQYGWSGQVVLSIAKNEKAAPNAQTSIVLTQMSYDSLGRIARIEKKTSNSRVNNGSMPASWKTILQNEYNALGQLKKKKLGAAPLDSLNYDYNIRGWMLGMNRSYVKDTSSTTNWFGFDLGYDKTGFTVNGANNNYVSAQYNGNICGMLWRSTGDDRLRKYDFTYDAVNRLTGADFNQFTNSSFSKSAKVDFSVTGLSYDANGNILTMNQKGWVLGGSITIDSLLYTYFSNCNKLLNVLDGKNDTATRLGDFRSSGAYMRSLANNKTVSAADYSYDGNGSMIQDNNKDISYIHYNHLNLPDSIVVTGKGFIKYIYDAAGIKLKKVTTEGTKVTSTLYMYGNFVNDTLQFLPQEEGRIRYNVPDSSLQYDYFIKDHLGNVRMVLTEQQQTDAYPVASLEASSLSSEKRYYSGLDTGRLNKSTVSGYPSDNYTNPNDYIQQLSGNGAKIGAGILLKVMAGDQFNLFAKSWWNSGANPGSPMSPLEDLKSAMAGSIGVLPGKHATYNEITSSGVLSPNIASFLGSQGGYNSSRPKAFVNWMLLDEQFNYVATSSGFEQVGGSNSQTTHTRSNLPIDKSGYLYIYVSNETPNINVYFDDLQVTHIRGPLVEETHYYPFGLTMVGVSSKALVFGIPENKVKFNSIELNNDFDINMYDALYRNFDAQIGRFWQIDPKLIEIESPYVALGNNPIFNKDPLGDTTIYYNIRTNEVLGTINNEGAKTRVKVNGGFYDASIAEAASSGTDLTQQGNANKFVSTMNGRLKDFEKNGEMNEIAFQTGELTMSFTGAADQSNAAQANGTLSVNAVFDDNSEISIASYDAIGGPFKNGAPENGAYTADHWEDRSPNGRYSAGMNRDGVGFSLDLNPQFSTWRIEERIHPDGGVKGTQGCIGLRVNSERLIEFSNTTKSYLRSHTHIKVTVNISGNPNNNGRSSRVNNNGE
jgi:RHS repeat-associated protein